MAVTYENHFEVPERDERPLAGIFIQATKKGTDDGKSGPGAFGFVRVREDPAGQWHDEINLSEWQHTFLSHPERLRLAKEWAQSRYPEDTIYSCGNALGGGSVYIGDAQIFKQLLTKLQSIPYEDEDNTPDSDKAEKLVYVLEGNDAVDYKSQQTPGYDIKRGNHYNEVKSFKGNAQIHFTSAQLDKMKERSGSYFVWLVRRKESGIGFWEIYKLPGDQVYEAIQHLAKGKFAFQCNGTSNLPHLSVGVKFKLPPGNGDGNGITVVANGETNGTQPLVTLADVTLKNGRAYPLTANEWYENEFNGEAGNKKWWNGTNGD